MKKCYQIEISANNLLLDFDGDHRLFDMKATCYVQAADQQEAHKTALARLMLDPALKERLVDEGQSRATYNLEAVNELGRLAFLRKKRSGRVDFQPIEEEAP